MKIVQHEAQIIYPATKEDWLRESKFIELAARNCYKSEDKITDTSYIKFNKMIHDNEHGAMEEFANIICKLTTDIRSKRDITRHRMCSFAVESTRYCNYSKDKYGNEITVVQPTVLKQENEDGSLNKQYSVWYESMIESEQRYLELLHNKLNAENAASVLPLATKCDIYMKCNWRQFFYMIKLRASHKAHSDVQKLFLSLNEQFIGNMLI